MSSSRERILNKLRTGQPPFTHLTPPENYLPMIPVVETDLLPHFIAQAEKLSCKVYPCVSDEAALQAISTIIGQDRYVLGWDFDLIPLAGLAAHLAAQGILQQAERDESVRVGITGVEAGLASTGSLVITSGAGKPRFASLLPPIHIAVVRTEQILPHFEAWIALKRASGDFREVANTVLISGPSRTADIAMQLTLGMHGPEELHIVLR